jgi:hypothetical protein
MGRHYGHAEPRPEGGKVSPLTFDLPLTGVNAGKEGNVFLDEELDVLRARRGWEFTIGRIMFVRRR